MQYELLRDAIKDKFEVLPIVAGVAAALLVVGSFSGSLFPLTNLVRFLISILLFVMVASLHVYIGEVHNLIQSAQEALYTSTGRVAPNNALSFFAWLKFIFLAEQNGVTTDKSLYDRIASTFPAFSISILELVVFVIIVLIWRYSC
jgi:hypothetical protein